VFRLTRRELDRLAAQSGESTDLAVLDGAETVLVQRIRGRHLVGVEFQVGDRSPLHCTSIGKAILAHQRADTIEEILSRPLARHASRTFTDPDALREELAVTRERGYAIDDHELSDSMRCIAAPIFERDTPVRLGISMSGPDSRFTLDYLDDLRPQLLEATSRLSEQLGGVAPSTTPRA
jgi:DNA-binding IclR family transcriptional regulator